MSTPKTVRLWYRIHKWTSLVCTLFLLMSCLTGLPLIFNDEIFDLSHPHADAGSPSEKTGTASLDSIVKQGRYRYPNDKVVSLGWDDDRMDVFLGMTPAWNSRLEDRPNLIFAAHSGKFIGEIPLKHDFLFTVLKLHGEIYAGLAGELFLGCMACLFVVALISGAVVYGSFMRNLDFGTVRMGRTTRLKWFDLHNLLGIVTLTWALVIGVTGMMNTLSGPLFELWRQQELPHLLGPYRGQSLTGFPGSVDAAVATAQAGLPKMEVGSIIFPHASGSSRHFLIWMHGKTPVTSRLFTPVLVDAQTGQPIMARRLPWYLRMLEVSRPLHFGDYGGIPLKILWALFDVALIAVLLSGVYLWLSRRKSRVENELNRLVKLEELAAKESSAARVLAP